MRRGLSLLEVVLALAILGVSLAVIGELIRMGSLVGEAARDDMEAQLICESLINEIAAGAEYPQMLADAPVDELGEWLYTVEAEPIDAAGLLAVRVTVRRSQATASGAPPFSLTRWMIDPAVEMDLRAAEAAMQEQLALRKAAQESGTEVDNSTTAEEAAAQGNASQGNQPGGQPMGDGQPGRGGAGRRGGPGENGGARGDAGRTRGDAGGGRGGRTGGGPGGGPGAGGPGGGRGGPGGGFGGGGPGGAGGPGAGGPGGGSRGGPGAPGGGRGR